MQPAKRLTLRVKEDFFRLEHGATSKTSMLGMQEELIAQQTIPTRLYLIQIQSLVGPMKNFMNDELYLNLSKEITPNLAFDLRHSDSRIPCCIWGNLTDILHSACNQDDGMVTGLLNWFAKLGKFRGELQIYNAFDASQMIINPTIPDAEAFKDMDNGDDTTLMTIAPFDLLPAISQSPSNRLDIAKRKDYKP
ncbi:hypothetical protein HID58_054359 [Brassica napus]|uniref:Uncharacterized protein n=1 Tax=Brassica napus TaxID=3708 RepID=A0ABQ8AHB7_BRANA|nr:hypothetical protein HID58_054359 [Brassica napus]